MYTLCVCISALLVASIDRLSENLLQAYTYLYNSLEKFFDQKSPIKLFYSRLWGGEDFPKCFFLPEGVNLEKIPLISLNRVKQSLTEMFSLYLLFYCSFGTVRMNKNVFRLFKIIML